MVQDRLKKVQLFEETFLLANTNIEVVLIMVFLTFFDVNIWFVKNEPIRRSYMTAKTLFITKRVELIDKKE